ncbi:hypothetical protein [Variovorax sp. PAMC 28711]|uniref:hypothetical protein n=1 Tax=Variovorax sp. PAMC 28711 TaxID=1795631 RepID=UPI00078E138E|nr:hypothetical protein [Variovorax sp. PAMC 28711]AMM23008.1 hypothetical protein AX767_00385 [Variovorax sp. PAMC 28711]
MTCPSCAIAAHTPDTGHQHAGCRGCAVRALAQGRLFHASGVDGLLSAEYRKALSTVAGDDWRALHDEVKAQAARIRDARAVL